jgi:hypothetical protein
LPAKAISLALKGARTLVPPKAARDVPSPPLSTIPEITLRASSMRDLPHSEREVLHAESTGPPPSLPLMDAYLSYVKPCQRAIL